MDEGMESQIHQDTTPAKSIYKNGKKDAGGERQRSPFPLRGRGCGRVLG